MRVYSRYYGPLDWTGGANYPSEGISFVASVADLDDELAARMVLEFPESFKLTAWPADAMLDEKSGVTSIPAPLPVTEKVTPLGGIDGPLDAEVTPPPITVTSDPLP